LNLWEAHADEGVDVGASQSESVTVTVRITTVVLLPPTLVEFARPVEVGGDVVIESLAEPVEVGISEPVVDELNEAVVVGFGADGEQFRTSNATVPRMVIQ